MFKRFIVATDLSQESDVLIDSLGGLKAFGAEECLLLQCMTLQQAASMSFSYGMDKLDRNLEIQKSRLEEQGYRVETRSVVGTAKKEVNEIALKEGYSLIVVGAEEDTLMSRALFGGLAYDVIQHAEKPVLIVRLEEIQLDKTCCVKSNGCEISSHILFPTDFSENAELAFEHVEEMVEHGAGKVTLLHVQDKNIIKPYLEDRLEEFNKQDMEHLDRMKKALEEKRSGVEVQTVVRFGSPSIEILKLEKEICAEFVVMGSQGRGFVKELFLGSVSNNIARHSKASVLLVPIKREKRYV